jgi:hypothetical protein
MFHELSVSQQNSIFKVTLISLVAKENVENQRLK